MKNCEMKSRICYLSMSSDKIKYCEGSECMASMMIMKMKNPDENEYRCILLKKGD